MLQGIVFLLLGWIAGKLGWFQVISPTSRRRVAAIVLMFVISVALTGLGFLIAWRMDSTQGFHAIMSVFLLPMWLLSGAFFPMDVGGWLGWIIRINPLTYGVAGLRHYLQNGDVASAHLPSLATCWIVSLAFAAVIFAADLVDCRNAIDRRFAMSSEIAINAELIACDCNVARGYEQRGLAVRS